jgi:hypothetical protein
MDVDSDSSDDGRRPGLQEYLLAYIEVVKVGRIKKKKLVYVMPDKKYHEFVDLANVQELVGIVKSQGHEFLVSKASCF